MNKLQKNINGFSVVELCISLVFLIAVVLVGYSIASRSGKTAIHAQSTTTGDTVYRWGSYGLYTKANNEAATPTSVANLTNITAVAAGNASDMALDSNGNVWVWGDNANTVLGNGPMANQISGAVEVTGLPKIVKIAESDNTDVAITASGSVYGWGWNEAGQTCSGNETEYHTPHLIASLSNVVSAAGAGPHILYLLSNGTVVACGNNADGELGTGTLNNSTLPVQVTGLPAAVTAISAGQVNSAALLVNGQVWSWGWNKFGQLGNGTNTTSDIPVQVQLPMSATAIYVGGDANVNGQSLALLTNGTVWGWGNNKWGQLGNGTKNNSNVPVQATSLPSNVTFTAIASGGSSSLALDSNGNVWSWGNNDEGQVGSGPSAKKDAAFVLTPVEVLSHADMISATADDIVAHVPAATN